ncbi:MAG: hypothetical protein ABIQ59_15380 [Nocardioidaceae bacterium]
MRASAGHRADLLVAWPTVASAVSVALLTTGLALLLSPMPVPVLVVHLAQLALAGGAAYLLDDAAAALTGVAPRPTWRRRAPHLLIGGIALTGSWVTVLLCVHGAGLSTATLSLETGTLIAVALAAATVLVRLGEAEPGALVAPGVVLSGLASLLVGGLLHREVFASGTGAGSTARTVLTTIWGAAAGTALVVLLMAWREPARGRSSPTT